MSDTKLQAAKELIQSKNYDAARAVLKTMPDNVTAIKWLAKLDLIAPAPAPVPVAEAAPAVEVRYVEIKRKPTNWVAVFVVLVFVGFAAFVGYSIYAQHAQGDADAARAAYEINKNACSITYQMYSAAWQNCVGDAP